MGVPSGTPVRVFDVVTDAVDGAVPFHFTLWSHKEGWAEAFNDGLCGINQWQAIGDGVFAEAILFGHITGGLLNDGGQVADFFRWKLAVRSWQTDTISGRSKSGIHSLVGDAGVFRKAGIIRVTKYTTGMIKGRRSARTRNDECTAGVWIGRSRRRRRPELGDHRGGQENHQTRGMLHCPSDVCTTDTGMKWTSYVSWSWVADWGWWPSKNWRQSWWISPISRWWQWPADLDC